MSKTLFKGSVMLNPTPVVLITSKNKEDKVNVFTVGWISTVCTKPPMIAMGIRPERLSYDYIKETMECVVNLPSRDMVKIVDYCGVRSGKVEDKIKHFNLELESGENITTPSLKKAPIALECKVTNITKLGTHDMFLCEVVGVKVEDSLINANGKIEFNRANLITYCHGEYFGINLKALGSFGYSVAKKKNKNKSIKENNNKSLKRKERKY
ncbi:flavin reductase family protein [uncultured Clostridium sp.]|uniref:flavin reductase family protein n=1 Tax=uncultured Clostridium sp. TaxID=59620 RepID=UPI0025D4EC6A|nr:flavin reductase family protein [uncultured Clostridium sp.]